MAEAIALDSDLEQPLCGHEREIAHQANHIIFPYRYRRHMPMLPLTQTVNHKLVPYLDKLIVIYAEMDRAYDLTVEHYGFKCIGCGHNCCRSRFYHHTHLEYLFILKGYRSLDNVKRAEIKKRALEVVAEYSAAYKKDGALRQMCPLNFDGLCILYPYRPLICRLHGIPHEFRTPDNRIIHGPGCDAFSRHHGVREYLKFDRTPFYANMARLESELKKALGSVNKLKMTVAEMIVSF